MDHPDCCFGLSYIGWAVNMAGTAYEGDIMILRYIIYLLLQRFLMGFVGNIFVFPIAWALRNKLKKGFMWWWLHDGSWYGDEYFQKKYKHKKTFWVAWMWAFRNPIHNFYYSRKITGKKEHYQGWATTHRGTNKTAWRTLLTYDINGTTRHKYGKWIDPVRSIMGVQRITFRINGKKYFRFSGSRPVKLWKNLYWVPEWKFGFENSYWAEQFHLFLFKRYNGKIAFTKHSF